MLLTLWSSVPSPAIIIDDILYIDRVFAKQVVENFTLSASELNPDRRVFVNLNRGPALVEIYDREQRQMLRRTISNNQGYWRLDGFQPDTLYNIHGISITGPYEDDFIGGVNAVSKPGFLNPDLDVDEAIDVMDDPTE